jgi:hypothetical protein
MKFTSMVSSNKLLNIPEEFTQLYDIEHEDILEVQIVKHKKSDGTIVNDET